MNFLTDPLLLSRIQFGFTISFHIVFPALTIGLAAYLAVLEGLWLKTRNQHYKDAYLFWTKIFAVCFGIGVVSGITMPFQFGTNWAPFTQRVAPVIGPLLAFEVLTAFFLEASFLGIMLFGWNRVSEKMHFFATCVVSVGTMVSAFWILSANSWMQTPTGFLIHEDGSLSPTNWLQVIFNPSFPYRFMHMMMAAFLTVACFVGGVSAWYLRRNKHVPQAKTMFAMAMLMMMFATPVQVVLGDLHGLNTKQYQPAKVAAMEGHWETETHVPLYLVANIDEENETTTGISIPNLGSLILGHSVDAEIKGLKDFPRDERPPVKPVFWFFRVMVGMGFAMLGLGMCAAIAFFRGRLFTSRLLHLYAVCMTPAGMIALLAGWYVTEIGRQPFTVYGVMKTIESVSPIESVQVQISMAMYLVSYILVFGAGMYYIAKLIKKGPNSGEQKEIVGAFHTSSPAKYRGVLREAFPGFSKGRHK